MAGDETRRRIGDTARKLKDGTRDQMDHVKSAIREGAGDVSAAINAGKDAFHRNDEKSPIAKERV